MASETSVQITQGSGTNIDVFKPAGGNLRQAVVFSDPTTSANIASVSAAGELTVNPGTGTFAVKLDPGYELGSIKGINSSVAVYFDRGNPTVTANAGTGTFGVNIGKVDGTIQVDVGRVIDSVQVKGITNSISTYISGTAGTLRVGDIPGTLTVVFDQPPSIKGLVNSIAVVPFTGTGGTLYDDGADAIRVLISGSHTAASLTINGSITGITNTVGVNIGKIDGTIQVNVGKIDDSVQVKGITNSINIYLGGTAGTIRVGDIPGTISVQFSPSVPTVKVSTGTTIAVSLDPGYTLGKVDQGVKATSANAWFIQDVNATATLANMGFSAGSVSGISASGNTIVAPAASASRKIFAYNLTASATLSNIVANFTNGAGTSPTKWTENWLNGTIAGNAVTPPGYLFATGANVTLALLISNAASPVHYSIYWFNEAS